MTRELAERMVAAAEIVGVRCEMYPDYSGRGMFGRTTTGIVVPNVMAYGAICMEVGHWMAETGQNTAEYMAASREMIRMSTDSMGRDVIVY